MSSPSSNAAVADVGILAENQSHSDDASSGSEEPEFNRRFGIYENVTMTQNLTTLDDRDIVVNLANEAFDSFESDAHAIILSDPNIAEEYLSKAKMKSNDQLSERSRAMGCKEHAYEGSETGYFEAGVITEQVGGIKVTGPPLHQAAATVGDGPKPSPAKTAGKRKYRTVASHRCKNLRCVHPDHVVWEDELANLRRKRCVGMIKFKIGGRVIMARAKECTCKGHCLNYATAA